MPSRYLQTFVERYGLQMKSVQCVSKFANVRISALIIVPFSSRVVDGLYQITTAATDADNIKISVRLRNYCFRH